MKYNTAPYSTPPRSVLCQYNDHRWDVSHRHSGGSAVSSPRSKWRKHAQMGEAELKIFIITSSALSLTFHPSVSATSTGRITRERKLADLCQFPFSFYSATSSVVTHPAVSVCLSVLIKCLATDFNRSAFQSALDMWADSI